ncbi:MAG: hypothetical protein JJE27_05510 [Thermoleophilia bacterium]|nr:hypothetical protein [Thermoleophilia bacterium]
MAAVAAAVVIAVTLVAGAIAPQSSDAASKRKPRRANPFAALCSHVSVSRAIPGLLEDDVWRFSVAYRFPFLGHTPGGKKTVIWRKFPSSPRKTHYPAPNLPSCRVGRGGTEDRTARKAGGYFETLKPIDGLRSYVVADSFDRPVTTIHWEDVSLIHRHPERWGWYVGAKWAGHDATRAFEVQGDACKLRVQADTTVTGDPPAPVTSYRWVRDPSYVMIAFNPALGSPGGGFRPGRTSALRVRGFVDRRALPGWAHQVAGRYDFGCGSTALTAILQPQMLGAYFFRSVYGPGRQYMIDQYFGESATQLVLLPGETLVRNNMPYSAYNPKPWFGNATYAMINTTGIAGGGMVRGIVRANVDEFTLYDEMRYCDPNYTLRNMLLKRNGRRVSKWNYFALAAFGKLNAPSVRWVYGEIRPNLTTITAEGTAASANPESQRLFAWMPIRCDR